MSTRPSEEDNAGRREDFESATRGEVVGDGHALKEIVDALRPKLERCVRAFNLDPSGLSISVRTPTTSGSTYLEACNRESLGTMHAPSLLSIAYEGASGRHAIASIPMLKGTAPTMKTITSALQPALCSLMHQESPHSLFEALFPNGIGEAMELGPPEAPKASGNCYSVCTLQLPPDKRPPSPAAYAQFREMQRTVESLSDGNFLFLSRDGRSPWKLTIHAVPDGPRKESSNNT